ncbi:MAG: hypothetical protein KAY24_09865 [Candidatus Eisenbacteria sp.]|nr:hypothetical protein [Candidatus Eisenbacteria bacterium]
MRQKKRGIRSGLAAIVVLGMLCIPGGYAMAGDIVHPGIELLAADDSGVKVRLLYLRATDVPEESQLASLSVADYYSDGAGPLTRHSGLMEPRDYAGGRTAEFLSFPAFTSEYNPDDEDFLSVRFTVRVFPNVQAAVDFYERSSLWGAPIVPVDDPPVQQPDPCIRYASQCPSCSEGCTWTCLKCIYQ